MVVVLRYLEVSGEVVEEDEEQQRKLEPTALSCTLNKAACQLSSASCQRLSFS